MSIKLTEQQQQELLAYVEGTLPPDAAARVEVFLANTDPQLAAQIADMIDQRHAVASLPKLKAPADMAQRIMEQVERESLLDDRHHDLGERPWWQARWLMAASVAMVVSAFGYYVIHEAMKNSATMDKWPAKVEGPAMDRPLAMQDEAPAPAAPQVEALPPQEQSQAGAQAGNQADGRVLALSPDNKMRQIQNRQAGVDQNYPQFAPMSARNAQQNNAQNQTANVTVIESQVAGAYARNDLRAPIVVTLAAHDPSDAERLRLLLLSMSGSTTMKSAASAPSRAVGLADAAQRKDKESADALTGPEELKARLTPEAFRRIAAQFSVVSLSTYEMSSPGQQAHGQMAARKEQTAQDNAAVVPMAGEAEYVFRFVPAENAKAGVMAAEKSATAGAPAATAAPAAKPTATPAATQNHP